MTEAERRAETLQIRQVVRHLEESTKVGQFVTAEIASALFGAEDLARFRALLERFAMLLDNLSSKTESATRSRSLRANHLEHFLEDCRRDQLLEHLHHSCQIILYQLTRCEHMDKPPAFLIMTREKSSDGCA